MLAPLLLLLIGVSLTTPSSPKDPCSLFTQTEIKTLIGVAVNKGEPAIAGCQWVGTTDDEAVAQIEIIEDTSYYEPHKGAKGYLELKGVGLRGWTGYELDAWVASSNTGTHVLVASVGGGKSDRDTAINFLKMLMARVK
jgi:hypothetical protein